MSNATEAYPLSDAEARERAAMLKRLGLNFTKPDAQVIPLGHPARRKPLGLGIVPGDDTAADGRSNDYLGPERTAAKIVAESLANLSEEAHAQPATMKDLFELGLGMSLELSFAGGDDLRDRLRAVRKEIADGQGALRSEIAELKLALTEARCEIREMRTIQESARAVSRGEQGVAGPRGIPGPPGEGRTGPAGRPGRDAPTIVAWEADCERFEIVPVLSTGARGAPLCLMGLFQSYDSATNELEDRDLESAARASRAETERQAEAFRQGR